MKINVLEALSMIPRSLISLICLFLITRLLGKKQVSELSLFDYVIGISIGNFTAEMILVVDSQYINGVIAIFVFGFIGYLGSVLTMKSIKLRRFLIGVPTIVIYDGKILENSLKKLKIDVNDLLEQARVSGYFSINDIAYAIMEVNGKISFLPKEEYKPVTKKDMNIKENSNNLDVVAIIDGKLMRNNLKDDNIKEEYIYRELENKKVAITDVLLGIISNNNLVIYKKNNDKIKKILE